MATPNLTADQGREYRKKYYQKNREKVIARAKQWVAEHRERHREFCANWKENNQERVARVNAEWLQKNTARAAENNRAWVLANPIAAMEKTLRYQAAKLRATPPWCDLDAIQDVYAEAQYHGLEVDHIIPLQGKNVCGLHVFDNLQILTMVENKRKHNKFDCFKHDGI